MSEKVSCLDCDLSGLCVPLGLDKEEVNRLDAIVQRKKRVEKKAFIYRRNDAFEAFYAIRRGAVKTIVSTKDGKEQITGFFLPGEIFGMDGLATQCQQCDAIALQNSSFCLFPMKNLDPLAAALPHLRQRIMTLLGRQIASGQEMMMLLGNKNAEERVVSFLLGLSVRKERYGFSGVDIELAMTREDMAKFLGLTIETVSRTFGDLKRQGLIDYKGRQVFFKNIPKLKQKTRSCSEEP